MSIIKLGKFEVSILKLRQPRKRCPECGAIIKFSATHCRSCTGRINVTNWRKKEMNPKLKTEEEPCPCGEATCRGDCEVCQDLSIETFFAHWKKLRKE